MAENNFVKKTLDTLLKIVEVEFKIPLGFAEIKFPVTAHAKEWWANKKSQTEIQEAIKRAEEKFIADHPDQKVAQILKEIPLYAEEDYQKVITNLLINLNEGQINWLAETKIQKIWGSIVSIEEIQKTLELYIPYLRDELRTIKEFREVITALTIERIDKRTERIEGKLDEALKLDKKDRKPEKLNTGWFFGHQVGDIEFTGRDEERKMLKDWLDDTKDNLLVLRALGGFGKTSLAWEWLNNDVEKQKWHTAIWWSFYEKESGFENFLAETLKHLGIETKENSSSRQQVNDLLEVMQQTNILIVMDGFERLLRQYAGMDAIYKGGDDEEEIKNIDPSQRDCVSFDVENFLRGLSKEKLQSKVLMTTRLTPRVLEGKSTKLLKRCREESLDVFKPEDAIKYFQKEGIKATRTEILEVSTRYGFHPLSLSLLVGLINEDHDNPSDINIAKQLDIFDDIKANRYHILERAFESLTSERSELLSKLSCFRGSIEYDTIKKLFNSPDLDKSLIDLRKRGLLKYTNETKSYDMHPIVRHYVYDRFTDKDRRNTHFELVMHFIDVAPVTNKNLKTLEDFAPLIELYHHMVGAGRSEEALTLFVQRFGKMVHYQFGNYELEVELLGNLFDDNEFKKTKLINVTSLGFSLNQISNAYALSGQPRRAVQIFDGYISISENRNDKMNIMIGKGNMAGYGQFPIGALKNAEDNLRQSIEIGRELGNDDEIAYWYSELGKLLIYKGEYSEAEKLLNIAQEYFEKNESDTNYLGINWTYFSLYFLMIVRESRISHNRDSKIEFQVLNNKYLESAIQSSRRALELANEQEKYLPVPRDNIRAYWLLGVAYCANGGLTGSTHDLYEAEENLSKAVRMCRQINLVESEAIILLDLAKLRYTRKNIEEAKSLADEALLITERCGYVLQGADVNLFLSKYALEHEKDKVKAKEYAQTALKLAYCDGPPYYYKVAYHEAEAMLEKLK